MDAAFLALVATIYAVTHGLIVTISRMGGRK